MEYLGRFSSPVNSSHVDSATVSWNGTASPWGRAGCLTDLVGAGISVVYAVFAPCVALCLKRTGSRTKSTDVSGRRFSGHFLRAFLIATLIILLIFDLGEYFVTLENFHLPIHVALAPFSQILAIVGGLILHSIIEEKGLPVVMVLETVVWAASAFWRFSRMMNLANFGLDWRHTSYSMCAVVFVTYSFLAITDALAIYIELRLKKCSYRINRKYSSDTTDKNSCYKHNAANAFSQMTFWWLNLLLWQGYKEPLELEDLGNLPTEENASTQFKRFVKIYDKEKASSKGSQRKTSLWKCFFQYIWPNYCLGGIFKLLGDGVGLVGPLGISVIIDYTATYKSHNSTSNLTHSIPIMGLKNEKLYYSSTIEEFFSNGYIMGIVVFLAAIAQGTLSQSSTHFVNIEGIRLKSSIQSLIYDKYLRLAQWSANDVQTNIPDDSAKSFEGIIKSEEKDASSNTKKRLSIMKDENVDGSSITNLISEDSFNIMSFVWIGHYIWAIPLKIGVLMYFLYQKLGISAIIGATVCIFIMTPLQFLIGKSMSSNSKKTAERSDMRMMKINEVLQGIKILKMHSWEFLYCDRVLETREKELELLNKDSFYWALITFLTHASSVLITLLTFGIYFVLEEEQMTPANVFSGLALFNQLTVPLFIFPVTVPIVISALISTKRLDEFLESPEINEKRDLCKTNSSTDILNTKKDDKTSENGIQSDTKRSPSYFLTNIEEIEEENETEEIFTEINSDKESVSGSSIEDVNVVSDEPHAVKMTKGLFAWGSGEDALSKISIIDCVNIPKGKLTMVVGKTGSGKSSFLSALIGEMNQLEGKVTWGSDSAPLAYAPQRPWLLNATIRDNVTLAGGGGARRTRRYRRALTACSLRTDLTALPLKDLTEVGEGGAALSGGQKQRVALARALYSPAKVLLLDDPLAALDQPVAHKIFERGIKKMCIEKKRTVIMVTHKLQLLSHADQIIYVDNGKVRSMGSLANVESMEPALAMEWKSLLSRGRLEEPTEGVRERTARERWQLVRLVNRFSLQIKSKHEDEGDHNDELFFPSFIPLRKRFPTFHGSRYFTHDLLLPSDECDDEALRSTTPKRSSTRRHRLSQNAVDRVGSRKHKTAERSSSLQVSKHRVKPAPMSRQASSPIIHCNPNVDVEVNMSRTRQPGDNGQQRYLLRNLFPVSQQKLIDSQVDAPQITRQRSLINRLLSRSTSKPKNPVISPNVEKEHTPVRRLISTNSNISEDFPDDDTFCADVAASDKLATDEEREYGTIPKRIYLEYFKSCGIVAGSSYLISAVAWQCLRVYTDVWLSEWSGITRTQDGVQLIEDKEMKKYFTVYAILSIASILMSLASNAVGQYAGALARKTLHIKLIDNIIKCPMTFFETTPLGRIINRFSTDIGIIDKKIATSIQRLLQFLFLCLSAILINAAITPWFLIIALPICLVYYIVQKFYRCSSRELQRLDAITKSPVFSHFNETLGGLSSIRAYGQQERFVHLLWTKMDINTNAFIILNSSNRWLGIALDYLGGFIVFAAVNAALLTAKMYPETVTPSLVGLAINYTLLVPIYLNWVVKFLSDMEMYMSAVERVQQYSSLPTEDYKENGSKLPENWPAKGEITFSGVSLRYGAEKEPVVNKIDLHIPGGQKLAICGRTGSGKSSLLLALLRMVEACEGTIKIDGLDIRNLPLREVRSRIASAPQDGALFSGTIRENLVPGNRKFPQPPDDARIWRALKDAKLSSAISAYPGALDGSVVEGGAGWSGGERQLVGVARVLLKDSALLLLDEPTAALDPATESAVLSALTPSSASGTIVTIAHRLCTIMDYDRVIVMDGGRIVEDGPPKELLSRPMSIFSSMVRASDQ